MALPPPAPHLEEEADHVWVEHQLPPLDARPQRGVLLRLEHGDQTLRLCSAVKEIDGAHTIHTYTPGDLVGDDVRENNRSREHRTQTEL